MAALLPCMALQQLQLGRVLHSAKAGVDGVQLCMSGAGSHGVALSSMQWDLESSILHVGWLACMAGACCTLG
jgi:hypothetical protein